MDRFEVYDRENKTWIDDNIELMPGWEESFVQDKTTDNGKVKLKYKGINPPNWENGDWCRILHLENGETNATYIKKTDTIHRVIDYTLSECISLEYEQDTTILRVIFDVDKLGSKNISGGVSIWANTSNGKENLISDFTYFDGAEYNEINLSEEYSGVLGSEFIEYLPEQTSIVNDKVVTVEKDDTITYYVPKNHEQYLISNPIMVFDKTNDEWDIQIELLEPIEITNGIVCETRSFTNQISKTIDDIVYIHEKKNHLNVLESILRTTPANNDISKSWYSRIKIGNSSWLEKQTFNDDTFSEPTLYSILLDKYDSSLGRTPVLYFDIDGETDLPFNNLRAEYALEFIRQDGFDKAEVNMSNMVDNLTQKQINKSWANKADGIVSNIDNLAPSSSITYVSEYLWAVPEVDTSKRDISSYGENSEKGVWILKTPHMIKNIKSIKQLYVKSETVTHYGVSNMSLKREIIDLSNIVYEKKQYNANNDVYDTRDAIWYEEGTNIIHLNNFYFRTDTGCFFRIEYEPLIGIRYDEGKDYSTIVNQVDGQVSEDRISKYLNDYLSSMNKTDIIISKTVEKWSDIIDVGTRIIDNDKNYIITNVSVVNRGFEYDVIYQLNENHIRKNDSIIAPQNIRKDIEISYNGLTDRRSCFIQYYKLSLKDDIKTNNIKEFISKKCLYYAFLKGYEIQSPQLAKLRIYNVYENGNGTKTLNYFDRLCNGSKSIINNTICFNLKYEDNAICGNKKELYPYVNPMSVNLATLKTSPKNQIPILYTDGFGEIKLFDMSLVSFYHNELSNIESSIDVNDFKQTNSYIDVTTNYPLTTGIDESTTTYIATIKDIAYEKDMLDIFNYTIGFKIESDNQIILCKKFFENSGLIKGVEIGYISTNTTNVQENDLEFTTGIEIDTATIDGNEITIVSRETITDEYKSIVLWDINKMPVMIINDADKLAENQFNGQVLKLYC